MKMNTNFTLDFSQISWPFSEMVQNYFYSYFMVNRRSVRLIVQEALGYTFLGLVIYNSLSFLSLSFLFFFKTCFQGEDEVFLIALLSLCLFLGTPSLLVFVNGDCARCTITD